MMLADGRRILPAGIRSLSDESEIIRLHPDFRMIVLANRPGFPFLGNDFFASLGDVFGVHAVENPSLESELQLLRNYGPSVSEPVLRKLVESFSQLRSMADQGQLTYPYSTREVINIVKHLEKFPSDGLVRVVSNVFDFDAYSPQVKETITRVFHQHGIPLGASINSVALAQEMPLSDPVSGGRWQIAEPVSLLPTAREVGFSGKFSIRVVRSEFAKTEARLLWFTEEKCNWKLPFGEVQAVQELAASDGIVHVLATNPSVLFSVDVKGDVLSESHLDRYLDAGYYGTSHKGRFELSSHRDVVLVYDGETGKLLIVNTSDKNVQVVDMKDSGTSLGRLSQKWMGKVETEKISFGAFLPRFNAAVFYPLGGTRLDVLNLNDMTCQSHPVNFTIASVFLIGDDRIVINQQDSNQ